MTTGENEPKPLDDSEHGQIEKLKGELKILNDQISKLIDSQTAINQTQGAVASNILKVKAIADEANEELAKTKTDLAAALEKIQTNAAAAFQNAFKVGMAPFAEELKKANQEFVDSRITQILGNQGAAPEPELGEDGQPLPTAPRRAMIPQQSGGGGGLAALLTPETIQAIVTKIFAPPAATPPAGALVADALSMAYRIVRANKDLNEGKVDPDVYDKQIHQALAPKPQA